MKNIWIPRKSDLLVSVANLNIVGSTNISETILSDNLKFQNDQIMKQKMIFFLI